MSLERRTNNSKQQAEKASGLDRRTLLVAAAASVALAAPTIAVAQSQETAPGLPATSNDTPQGKQGMSTRALSKLRLERLHDAMARHVESDRVPGLVSRW